MRNPRPAFLVPALALSLALGACGGDSTSPIPPADQIEFSTGQIHSLDSTGHVIEQANASNATLKSLVDSTLLIFTSGVVAKRLDVTTNLTSAPLYFVGVHRVVTRTSGSSFSTWNVVGMDDPSHLTSITEVSGFAESSTSTAPTSVSATIGDGSGSVNGLLLSVGAAGAVTEWFASAGSVSFSAGTTGGACPNFTATANLTCSLETIRVHFAISAPAATQGGSGRQASVATDVDVPTMRLSYTF
jgi:hypothetical protein